MKKLYACQICHKRNIPRPRKNVCDACMLDKNKETFVWVVKC